MVTYDESKHGVWSTGVFIHLSRAGVAVRGAVLQVWHHLLHTLALDLHRSRDYYKEGKR